MKTSNSSINQQSLEMKILSNIKRVSRGIDLVIQMQIDLMSARSNLRNQIGVYQCERSKAEIDDLFAAIIRDQALPKEEILRAFDYNETRYKEALKRIDERNAYKKK